MSRRGIFSGSCIDPEDIPDPRNSFEIDPLHHVNEYGEVDPFFDVEEDGNNPGHREFHFISIQSLKGYRPRPAYSCFDDEEHVMNEGD